MSGEPPKSQSWWQTLPGILTAVAGIMTASTGLILALNQVGVFSRESTSASPTPNTAVVLSASPSAKPATIPDTEVSAATGVDELSRVKAANIMLSTGGADERENARILLTVWKLLIVCWLSVAFRFWKSTSEENRLSGHIRQTFSEMGDESIYVPVDGKLNLEKVKQAMVKAQREYHGDQARTFERDYRTSLRQMRLLVAAN